MLCRYILAPLAALLLAPGLLSSALAQRPGDWGGPRGDQGEWVLLGSTRIGGLGVDRDVIDVGRREGSFARIGLEATQSPIFIHGLTIVYGNDEVQQVDLRQRLDVGQRTAPIDLRGRGRPIKRIEVAARAGHDMRRRAVLNVYAEQVFDRGRPGEYGGWRGWRAEWEFLGQNNIGFGTDRDVIRIGRDGRYSQIVIEVGRNGVNFTGATVFFMGGPPQPINLRQSISPGGHTDPIPLAGGGRGIDRVEIYYKRQPGDPGRADVAVFGLRVGGPPPPPPGPPPQAPWEQLGCQDVGFGADRDVVRVGRQEGRFSAIRLRIDRADVFLISLRVVYERGPADDYQINNRIRAGTDTPPLDLRGERRAIRQVELVYSSIPSFRGTATVCVDGR